MIKRINIKKLNMKYCDYLQIYLPDNFDQTKEKYDVIYMHDGHNLFNEKTSAFGLIWRIDQVMRKRKKQYIIVGIECSNIARYNLYSPWEYNFNEINMSELFTGYGGLGDEYVAWIINRVIPFINQKYISRTNNTYMAGSSMGGLISLYAGIVYNKIFKAVGVFSPAIWFSKPKLLEFLNNQTEVNTKIYMDIGHKETSNVLVLNFPKIYLNDAQEVFKILSAKKSIHISFIEDKTGLHNELSWGRRFSNFLNFIEN